MWDCGAAAAGHTALLAASLLRRTFAASILQNLLLQSFKRLKQINKFNFMGCSHLTEVDHLYLRYIKSSFSLIVF